MRRFLCLKNRNWRVQRWNWNQKKGNARSFSRSKKVEIWRKITIFCNCREVEKKCQILALLFCDCVKIKRCENTFLFFLELYQVHDQFKIHLGHWKFFALCGFSVATSVKISLNIMSHLYDFSTVEQRVENFIKLQFLSEQKHKMWKIQQQKE